MTTTTGIELTVNGRAVRATVEPRTSLADFLREQQGLPGTHVSCEQGVCGACTVLLDGRPVRACITWAAACEGADVRTIEGFDDDPLMQRLREAFSREHALQCGFCTPGMLITARDIALRLGGADERQVRYELAGNLCRCTGYSGIVRAVSSVVGAEAPDSKPGGAQATQVAGAAPASAAAAGGATAFDPVDVGPEVGAPEPASPLVAPSPAPAAGASAPQIAESIVVRGCDAGRLWELLADVRAAAACLPGARVEHYDGRTIAGSVRVAFGPIKASFAGTGTVERDEAARATVIRGEGADALSRTSAQATIVYRVEPEPGAQPAARLEVGMDYVVQGPLAQFSRSDLVRSLVTQIVRDFGRNLEAMAVGQSPPAPASAGINALGMFWAWLRGRLARWFGAGEKGGGAGGRS